MKRKGARAAACFVVPWVMVVLLVLITGGTAFAAAPAVPGLPSLSLDRVSNGAAAVDALGDDISTVSQAYGMTTEELRGRLLSERGLGLDKGGRLFYVCDAPAAFVPVDALFLAGVGSVPAPLSETFRLHSNRGADRVIYLDFTGDTLVGKCWNEFTGDASIDCPAWDIDGDVAVFGDAERIAIQQVWQRVAEDYAPFDVDVTTEEPAAGYITRSSTSDMVFGTRVLISPIACTEFEGAGGIAYIGVYDAVDVAEDFKPALVFPQRLLNDARYIAEAVAHEAGHNLGLYHDGTSSAAYYQGHGSGVTGWAPIMGVGYYQNRTQWSKGEYAGSNNQEDDLAVIRSNGLAYRGDDYGNTPATATDLPVGELEGFVTTPADVDCFRVLAGAGAASFSAKPNDLGANLDVSLELIDSAGTVLQTSNPVGALDASISVSLAAGTYYLRVEGVGEGLVTGTGYSDYGSLGRYVVTGSFAPVGVAGTSVEPAQGATDGGGEVIIRGLGFVDVTEVTFGALPASFVVDSARQITATAPPHLAGTVQVKVITATGESDDTLADDYTYVELPTITHIEPSSCLTTGGTTVAITGTGFAGVTGVRFGTTNASVYSVLSDNVINAVVPAHAAGTVSVVVSTPAGASANTAADDFTYLAPTRYEQTSPLLYYQGSWSQSSSSSYSGGSYKYTNTAGAGVTATFTGTAVSLVAKTGSTLGLVRITLDGGDPVLVDLYSSSSKYKQTVWSATALENTTHTLLIERSGLKGKGSGYSVNIDALDIGGTRIDVDS